MKRELPAPPSMDPLTRYQRALRERFPSIDEITRQAQARKQRRKVLASASATSVLCAALVLWGVDPTYRTDHYDVASGSQLRQTLADGSRMQLDGGTTLNVAWHLRSRHFQLITGEAVFDVAHGPRSFIVQAGSTQVRDIGTVFDVRQRDDSTRVIVFGGVVEVASAGRSVSMSANQAVNVIAGAPPSDAMPVDAQSATVWREGKLAFDNLPLSDAVREMQAFIRAPLIIDDARAGALRLSAVFDRAQADAMLPLLSTILPITVHRASDGAIHLASRGKS